VDSNLIWASTLIFLLFGPFLKKKYIWPPMELKLMFGPSGLASGNVATSLHASAPEIWASRHLPAATLASDLALTWLGPRSHRSGRRGVIPVIIPVQLPLPAWYYEKNPRPRPCPAPPSSVCRSLCNPVQSPSRPEPP